MIKDPRKGCDELHNYEIMYVGKVVRLEVPLKSVISLRRVAGELRGLATQIDGLSRQLDERPTYVMLCVRDAVRRCNKNMAAIRGRGRPKKHHTPETNKLTATRASSRKPAVNHKM